MVKLYPDWLPANWKDSNLYPDQEKMTYQEWAWEFLRRNEGYQQAHRRFVIFLQSYLEGKPESEYKCKKAKKYRSILDFLLADETAHLLMDCDGIIKDFCYPLWEKFKVSGQGGIPNPADSFSKAKPLFHTNSSLRAKVYTHTGKLLLSIEGGMIQERNDMFFKESDIEKLELNKDEFVSGIHKKPTEILFTIDIGYNYTDQIDAVKKLLNREKKRLNDLKLYKRITKKKDDLDVELLMILDAISSGAKPKELAVAFFPREFNNEQRKAYGAVDDLRTRAEALCCHDYIKIASL